MRITEVWQRWLIIIIISAIGLGLSIWQPIWISPPHLADTPLIYGLLRFLWLPLWLAWFIFRHSFSQIIRNLIFAVVLTVTIAGLVWIIPKIHSSNGYIPLWGSNYVALNGADYCSQDTTVPSEAGQLNFFCNFSHGDGWMQYYFSGSQADIFVRLVKIKYQAGG